MIVDFPDDNIESFNDKVRRIYYPAHFKYIRNVLEYGGNTINLFKGSQSIVDKNNLAAFKIIINGKSLIIDYSNHLQMLNTSLPYFKFTVIESIRNKCIPLSPCSFSDWKLFEHLTSSITYQANTSQKIFYKQRYIDHPKFTRRNDVFRILKNSKFSKNVDFNFEQNQLAYFNSLNNCYAQIIISGARPNTLDRTHMQLLGLGIPFITPIMQNYLPGWIKLEPDINYIQCKSDHSDLEERIDYVYSNPMHMAEISANNRNLFMTHLHPAAIQRWILQNL